MTDSTKSFGQTLRDARIEKGFSLRKFAKLADVSPTYLSQVEQGKAAPPTADRVKTMAELLGANSDEWISLAGRVPGDLPNIIQKQPTQMPELMREASGLTPKQLQELTDQIRRMKEQGK